MPATIKIPLLGKERAFRISMATLQRIRDKTGLRVFGVLDLMNHAEQLIPVLLYEGLVDKGEIASAEWLAEELGPNDAVDLLEAITRALVGEKKFAELKAAEAEDQTKKLATSAEADLEKNGAGPARKIPARKHLQTSKTSGPSPSSTSA